MTSSVLANLVMGPCRLLLVLALAVFRAGCRLQVGWMEQVA